MTTFTKCTEGELLFDFKGCLHVEKLDLRGRSKPEGMSLVDFVVEESDRCLLIEVKDPSAKDVPLKEKQEFICKLENKEWIYRSLVPKCRDSYTYLHLMERDDKPFLYLIVLGIDLDPKDSALIMNFQDCLRARLAQETDRPWKRKYVRDCVVLPVKSWEETFKKDKNHYTVERISRDV